MPERIVRSDFFNQPTQVVAREIIGRKLIRQIGNVLMASRIVEAEAYLPKGDLACHAAHKRTPKNEVMFGKPGLIYVYSIHTRYCVNFVTETEGSGCAVLIRAAAPLMGMNHMLQRRPVNDDRQLLNGPAKICQAKEINKELNGLSLGKKSGLWLVDDGVRPAKEEIVVTPRIGVTSDKEKPLRFVWRESPFASGPLYMRK